MTINATSNSTPVAQAEEINHGPAAAKAQAVSAKADTVQISDAAKLSATQLASQALLQEAAETSAQTAQEARHGDHQAQRLVAKYAAAHQ